MLLLILFQVTSQHSVTNHSWCCGESILFNLVLCVFVSMNWAFCLWWKGSYLCPCNPHSCLCQTQLCSWWERIWEKTLIKIFPLFTYGLGFITRGTSLAHVLSTREKTTGDPQWERQKERQGGYVWGGVTKQKMKRDIKEKKELKEVRPITCLVLPSKIAGTGGSSRQSHSAEQQPLRRR